QQDQTDFCWDPLQKCFRSTNGIVPESKPASNSYDITALATSSLFGLVQTIKDHITKPTAMARGRVAHLIEWKGWNAQRTGWDSSLTDEEHYSYLTDELKEARFAAGVAEQFAITEATLSAWSSLDDEEELGGKGSQDAILLQDTDCIYLQDHFLSGSQGIYGPAIEGTTPMTYSSSVTSPIPPQIYSQMEEENHREAFLNAHSASLTGSLQIVSPQERILIKIERNSTSSGRGNHSGSIHYVDSSSLSEDEVFYN
uniref:Family with sequence similarity 131 member C n=1 Tax=Latimeria chalumnae TaxID=7897 RepID=H3AKH9_LATCH